ncbi:MAG: hypothetical protein ACI37O_08595 [Candidatus Avelusimicrobium sp.]|uniref:hypothetical protein n=1 Tax=Candidatus Avelusimicrobium sp. TaxID=3048833 RepID=UPI003F00F210
MLYFLLVLISLYLISLGFIVGVRAGKIFFGFVWNTDKPYERCLVAIFMPIIFFYWFWDMVATQFFVIGEK